MCVCWGPRRCHALRLHQLCAVACSFSRVSACSPTLSCWLPNPPGLQHTHGRPRLDCAATPGPAQQWTLSKDSVKTFSDGSAPGPRLGLQHNVGAAADARARCHPVPSRPFLKWCACTCPFCSAYCTAPARRCVTPRLTRSQWHYKMKRGW